MVRVKERLGRGVEPGKALVKGDLSLSNHYLSIEMGGLGTQLNRMLVYHARGPGLHRQHRRKKKEMKNGALTHTHTRSLCKGSRQGLSSRCSPGSRMWGDGPKAGEGEICLSPCQWCRSPRGGAVGADAPPLG
jgi:hypothetical protein